MLRLKDLLEDGTELNIYGRFPGLEGRKSGGWGENEGGGLYSPTSSTRVVIGLLISDDL